MPSSSSWRGRSTTVGRRILTRSAARSASPAPRSTGISRTVGERALHGQDARYPRREEHAMIGCPVLVLLTLALLVSVLVACGLPRPAAAQDLLPAPVGQLGGREPLPTAEGLP